MPNIQHNKTNINNTLKRLQTYSRWSVITVKHVQCTRVPFKPLFEMNELVTVFQFSSFTNIQIKFKYLSDGYSDKRFKGYRIESDMPLLNPKCFSLTQAQIVLNSSEELMC